MVMTLCVCIYEAVGWSGAELYMVCTVCRLWTACEKSLAMWAPGTLYLDYQRKQNILCFQSERGCDFSCSATFERHDLVLRKKRFPYYLPFVSRVDSRTKGKQCGAEALPMLSDWTLLIKSKRIYISNAYFIYRSSIFWSKLLTWHLSCVLSGWCEISHSIIHLVYTIIQNQWGLKNAISKRLQLGQFWWLFHYARQIAMGTQIISISWDRNEARA